MTPTDHAVAAMLDTFRRAPIVRDYSVKDLRAALGSSPPLEKMKMTKEHCIDCDTETGRAGRGEDSLHAGDFGPYCEECWAVLRETLAESLRKATTERDRLKSTITELVGALTNSVHALEYCLGEIDDSDIFKQKVRVTQKAGMDLLARAKASHGVGT